MRPRCRLEREKQQQRLSLSEMLKSDETSDRSSLFHCSHVISCKMRNTTTTNSSTVQNNGSWMCAPSRCVHPVSPSRGSSSVAVLRRHLDRLDEQLMAVTKFQLLLFTLSCLKCKPPAGVSGALPDQG